MGYYKELIQQSISRAKEATLSILGISDSELRHYLSDSMVDELGAEGCFLAPPVFEHTFGWKQSDISLSEMEGDLLSPQMIKTLDEAKSYHFSRDLKPYTHQLQAWNYLLERKPKSIVVTTGTGSGKTECFMIPILNDLINESNKTQKPLVGVRALFLYPLNALINSQQERLHAWTESFDQNIRFCLYNGKTEERKSKVRKEQSEKRNQILSRQLLREEPAPLLMTNATMLEYMLVRHIDSPILNISKERQSLRWIVLDEAHTYIGSQAAEISLLLRRVIHAFGRKAEDIRFIATSATIADDNANAKLKTFLADLAGIPENQVEVITGSRIYPSISKPEINKNQKYEQIFSIDKQSEISTERYHSLCAHPISNTLRNEILTKQKPKDLNFLVSVVSNLLQSETHRDKQYEVLEWIDLMTGTKPDSDNPPFLKLRIHLFQRMLHGLWSCVDPNCSEKNEELKSWAFGKVYLHQRSRCKCNAPVYEIGFCNDCKTPYLIAEDQNGFLKQSSPYTEDEFSLTQDTDDEDEDSINIPDQTTQLVIADSSYESDSFIKMSLNIETMKLDDTSATKAIFLKIINTEENHCIVCNKKPNNRGDFIKKAYLGAPFYISNSAPTILEYCPDPLKKDSLGRSPEELPGRGRKLITFTDSRQGTARMAVRMQQEAERSRLRGLVFQVLMNSQKKKEISKSSNIERMSYDELINAANFFEKAGNHASAKKFRTNAESLKNISNVQSNIEIDWNDMVEQLAVSVDISQSILNYNRYSNPALFNEYSNEKVMARLLLAREFSRRPKNQNSLETLGIIKIGYQNLQQVKAVPQYWKEIKKSRSYYSCDEVNHLTLKDWIDYLKVSLDFYIRENTYIKLDKTMQNWMGSRFFSKQFMPPTGDYEESSRIKKWPQVEINRSVYSRLVKLLLETTELESDRSDHIDIINTILEAAWDTLVKLHILERGDVGYSLNLNTLTFSFPDEAWICPVTQKLLDTTFCEITPYLPRNLNNKSYRCEKVQLPDFTQLTSDVSTISYITQVRNIVKENSTIKELRAENLWTDISDRTVEGGFYYRTAEHSAQQSSQRLDQYVEMFKTGSVNVLNCSTTMEMGVDIGGVSAVLMNNVPPHPANYLQRSGRAGRRNESRAIAYTLCKSNPHNQRAFLNPTWPFETLIPAPTIALSSNRIVQRHINSLFLSIFFRKHLITDKETTSLTVYWFFDGENSPCSLFRNWLLSLPQEIIHPVNDLTKGTGLSNVGLRYLVGKSKKVLREIEERWINEEKNLLLKIESASEEMYKKALILEKTRHESEYLLRDLATRSFLPGYGFPTDVVNFKTYNIADYIYSQRNKRSKSREDSIYNFKEQPSRSLNIAIREYAPGAQLVIDGRVYTSSGISLDWFNTGQGKTQKFDISWYCSHCGMTGITENAYSNSDELRCHACQNLISQQNKKIFLKPNGFVTDFYNEPSNDISSQKFIQIKKPRIQLHGSSQSLPDERCGFIKYGHDGNVFYQSSGEFDNGYAVCLKCGRAESMTVTEELPKLFTRSKYHNPLSGLDKKGKKDSCSNEGVMPSINLGYHYNTDVVEFYLKNPLTDQWLGTSDQEKIIANTIAVALRDAIAETLGIASTEMGFSNREDKELLSGFNRTVIQIYDHISGGAGFVLSGIENISTLFKKAFEKLICPMNCDNICSHCLASQDSRVEMQQLDRNLALHWISENHLDDTLTNPIKYSDIPDAKYIPFGPFSFIQSKIEKNSKSSNSTKLSIYLSDYSPDWDLLHSQFMDKLLNWIYIDKVQIYVGIKDINAIPETLYSELQGLGQRGIHLFQYEKEKTKSLILFCQIITETFCYSLFTSNEEALIPGTLWLDPNEPSPWIYSIDFAEIHQIPIDSSFFLNNQSNIYLLEISDELNGYVNELPIRFKTLLEAKAVDFIQNNKKKSATKIFYSDRYLKSPWTVLLISQFLKFFQNDKLEHVNITTQPPKYSRYSPNAIFHDWSKARDQLNVSKEWLTSHLSCDVDITVEENSHNIRHGRVLRIEWDDNSFSELIFDQGVGPWKSYFSYSQDRHYDFNLGTDNQLREIEKKFPIAQMDRTEVWPTYITFRDMTE